MLQQCLRRCRHWLQASWRLLVHLRSGAPSDLNFFSFVDNPTLCVHVARSPGAASQAVQQHLLNML
jgi:hypothetical protein